MDVKKGNIFGEVSKYPESFMLRISEGTVADMNCENKFGRATNVDMSVNTDIWDGANATDDIDIWVAPTQARIHQIKSSSAADDGNPVGVGARIIKIYGLVDWDSKEVNETIIMNGITNVPTENSYVIIHRMKVLTKGSTDVNVGKITAIADVDGTVTAQINAGQGQTQMVIYGFPSNQDVYMTMLCASFRGTAAATESIDINVLFNPEPNVELTNFLTKHTMGLRSAGTSYVAHPFLPYKKFEGPGIIKIQANGSANNLNVSADFDLILVDN